MSLGGLLMPGFRLDRQQLTPAEREKRDQVEFGHLTRRLLHAAAPLAS